MLSVSVEKTRDSLRKEGGRLDRVVDSRIKWKCDPVPADREWSLASKTSLQARSSRFERLSRGKEEGREVT